VTEKRGGEYILLAEVHEGRKTGLSPIGEPDVKIRTICRKGETQNLEAKRSFDRGDGSDRSGQQEENSAMAKGKAFLVVGHKNWGKSTTLKALTGGSRYERKWRIGSAEFFIRRMSNDDDPKDLNKLVKRLDPDDTPRLIATLCPTFNDRHLLPLLLDTLATLKRKYELFFFVLRHKCQNAKKTIPDDEIEKLERYGIVKIFSPEGAKPQAIARRFRSFVTKYA
jgi:hypothetical protein